ncbi:MAG: ATP-grasp domain-containing protein [Anaerolineae bacterium]|nr:ATP-grasp domain-containing protein [Anaerolineae bacterium]
MNVLLFSPHFPPNYYHFAVSLRNLGVNVLGLGDAEYHTLRPELRQALTEYYRVEDLHDYDQLVRACGYFTHRYGKLDRIESHNEYWLMTDAQLRTDFNVVGPKNCDIEWVKRKSKMKQVFTNAGIHVARGILAQNLAMAREFIAEVGYPVVAKPDIGVGAAATYKICDGEALACFFAEKPVEDYLMEEFLAGELYSFDGLTDQMGNIVFYTSHFFSQGIMETVNEGLELFYYSLRELPAELEDVGRRSVQAFNLRERFFHIEFFHLTDGRWFALEVNMRPPGGLTMDMFNYANDIDLYQEWANLVVSNRFSAFYSRPYHCAYVGRKYHLSHRLSHEEVLHTYGTAIPHHETISPVLAPAIGDYAYLVRSPDFEVLQRVIEGILAPA